MKLANYIRYTCNDDKTTFKSELKLPKRNLQEKLNFLKASEIKELGDRNLKSYTAVFWNYSHFIVATNHT